MGFWIDWRDYAQQQKDAAIAKIKDKERAERMAEIKAAIRAALEEFAEANSLAVIRVKRTARKKNNKGVK